jgi:membrane protein YdbS with pleckstrin-like domain
MENLYYNLSEQEFTKGRKILLWIFASLFFLAGIGIVIINIIFHDKSINISISAAPFGISLLVGIIAIMASARRKDHFFIIDEAKVEFKNGFIKPVVNTILWNEVKEIHFPHRQKKVKVVMKDDSSLVINLTWIEKKKSSHIRKHLYYVAKEKNINIIKSQVLS